MPLLPLLLAFIAVLLLPGTGFAHTIVTFGDSTTAPRGDTVTYSTLLAAELQFDGAPVDVINSAIPGDTTKAARQRFAQDVLVRKPATTVLMFGINDAAIDVWKKEPATNPRVPLADYRTNLTEMIRALQAQGSRVVLMTPNPLSWADATRKLYSKPPYNTDDPDGFNVVLREYVAAVREIAATERVGLVDVFAAFEAHAQTQKPTSLAPDGMHPGDAGHRLIADLLIAHFTAADPRYARRPFTAWHRSGDVVSMHPRATNITHDTPHPAVLGPALVKRRDGSVVSIYSGPTSYAGKPGEVYIGSRVTRDGGATWEAEREITRLPTGRSAHPTALAARDGTLHVFFLGYQKHAWDKATGNPTAATRCDLWAVRSTDDGGTWTEPQMIFEGYTGATNGAEETHDGSIVVPFSHYVANPGRLVSRAVVSADGGRRWQLSNQIDIGGAGDHEGALEPCVIEQKDRRLWMLIRTSRQFFWESFSQDGGLTWSPAVATTIPSSHSPGHIIRLHDGRLALVWNPRKRSELHVALSADDGRTWTTSTPVARGSACYPFLLEATPGELWVGFIDAHGGWGTTPRAHHLKIAAQDVGN